MLEPAPPVPASVPYPAIALSLRNRQVSLFLGAAASLAGAETNQLPSGRQLTSRLVELASYPGASDDNLAKVAQYLVETAADRDLMLDYLKGMFHDGIASSYVCSLTSFLREIDPNLIPQLIVSTNYDTLVERVFEERSIPYICISHVIGKSKFAGRLIVYERLGELSKANVMTRADAEILIEDRTALGELIVLYKMHGSASSYLNRRQRSEQNIESPLNSIVITEQDYIDFLDRSTLPRIPIQVQKMLYRAQFIFMGYSLADWNLRLLLHRLRESQEGQTRHWACRLSKDHVEAAFWHGRGVNVYDVSLDTFLNNLAGNLRGLPS